MKEKYRHHFEYGGAIYPTVRIRIVRKQDKKTVDAQFVSTLKLKAVLEKDLLSTDDNTRIQAADMKGRIPFFVPAAVLFGPPGELLAYVFDHFYRFYFDE